MDQVELEARNVDEAVEAALRQLGRRPEEVDIEVLEKGSRGVFGFGAKLARVRVRLKAGGVLPPEAIDRAVQTLVRVVQLMGMDIEVEAKHYGNELYLEIDQGAGGILIGRRGTTLAALSYLMERVVNHNEDVRVKVFVDVAGYLERKRRSLVTLAQDMAKETKRTGREVLCGPMSAFERKVIHTTLHNDSAVKTFSRGEGNGRRVVIAPAGPGESGEAGREEEGQRASWRERREGGSERGPGGDRRGGRRRRGGRGRRRGGGREKPDGGGEPQA